MQREGNQQSTRRNATGRQGRRRGAPGRRAGRRHVHTRRDGEGEARLGRVTGRGDGARARHVSDVWCRKFLKAFKISESVLKTFESYQGFQKCVQTF